MKRVTYFFSLILLVSLTTVFTSCSDDSGGGTETTEQIRTKQLTSGDYTVVSVERDGSAVDLESPVILSFNDNGTYSITGGDLPAPDGATAMPASGNWSFTDQTNFDDITLTSESSPNVVLTISILEDDELVFQYEGAGLKAGDPAATIEVTASR